MDMTPIQGFQPGSSILSRQGGAFGGNPFLRLLTEQLRNQTPLDPVDNGSFMEQVASYTTMQEQRDMNANLLQLLDFQGLLARLQGLGEGSALLGKQVSYTNDQGDEDSGRVESVFVDDQGDVRLRLDSGVEISMREVSAIALPPQQAPQAQ